MGRPRKPEPKPPRRPRGSGTIRQRRDGRWEARTPPDADGARETFYDPDLTVVTRWLNDRVAALARADGLSGATPLGAWLGRWFAATAPAGRWTQRTRAIYTAHIAHLGPLWSTPLADLKASQIQAVISDLLERGPDPQYRRTEAGRKRPRKPLTAGQVYDAGRLLVRALDAAVEDELIRRNPARRVVLPTPDVPERQIWTTAEARRLAAAIRGDPLEALWTLKLALGTGLRLGELRALQWSDVDLRARTVTVRASRSGHTDRLGPTKTGRVRTVELPRLLVPLLQRHRAQQRPAEAFVAARPDGQIVRAESYRQWLSRACRRAVVPVLPVHSARHTCASLLLGRGVPVTDVAHQLGHADVSTTLRRYAHFIGHAERRASTAMDGALSGVFGGEMVREHTREHISGDLHAADQEGVG